jgi:TolB-like protein
MDKCHRVFAFNPFELDECPCELLREGNPVDIHATPLRLLAYLVENRDRTIPKHELLDRVWPDSYVGENALTSALCEIRHALDDDGARQRMIRTERGRGYRFVASVTERDPDHSESAPTTVAVLPFIDMSPARDQEYLADGLTEELIYELSKLECLQVVSRTSVFAFKNRLEDVRKIGIELGAGTVVEGSVRTACERVRVTVQVIRAGDGCHLWSERYDRKLDDLLELQQDIARSVAMTLRDRLLGDSCGPKERGSCRRSGRRRSLPSCASRSLAEHSDPASNFGVESQEAPEHT